MYPDDRDTVIEAMRDAVEEFESFGLEFRIRRLEGSIRCVYAQGQVYRESAGQRATMVGTVVDITERKRVEDTFQRAHHELEQRVKARTAELMATHSGLQQQITARKQAEAALRASEQRYTKAAEIAHFGYWDRDFSKHAMLWSDEVYRIFGVAPGGFDGTYDAFLHLVHPDDRKRLKHAENTAISAQEPLDIEYRIVRPDGAERVIHSVVEGRFEETGKPVGLHGVVHDITQRKRAEEELRNSLRYQEIIASILRVSLSPVSLDEMLAQALTLVLTSHDLRLENKGCIFLIEDASQALVLKVRQGLPDSIMDTCSRIPLGRCLCGRVAQTGSVLHVEEVGHRHELAYTGMTPHGHYCVPILSDGTMLGVLNLYVPEGHRRLEVEERFVTAIADTLAVIIRRRRAEQALAEAQARYEDLYDNAPDMFASVEADTAKIIQCNQTLADALGYRKSEIVGHTLFAICHPECRSEVQKAFDAFAKTGEVRDAELQLQRKEGPRIDVSLNVTAVRDEHGKILHSRTAWRDITEHKLAEAQARAHQAQLAHVARLSTMGEMATGIAHEVNQPLTAMVTYTQACLRMIDSGTADFAKLRDVMQEIATQGLRAGEIIRRLREFTRMKETKGLPVDLNTLVREAVRFVEGEARDKGMTIVLDLADGLPEVIVDAIQIEQVILNLLRNGVDAMAGAHHGDTVLKVKTMLGVARTVQLSVSDTGPGLSETLVERIFDPFFTTKPQGMGMGLSISRSIIEAHKGHLWAEDRCRGGAAFHFTLPSATRESRFEH
jgi:PAS domain S-box-containing protein